MSKETIISRDKRSYISQNSNRIKLLTDLPVTERKIELAGVLTTILEGGDGPPMILLHGPGENSTWWMRTIPKLVTNFRVIIPDLPGHGESKVYLNSKNIKIIEWLGQLIESTSNDRPIVVGHILGGAIAARFAAKQGEMLERLILVNSLGLGNFRPTLGFAFGLIRFTLNPSEKNYLRFLPQCMYDPEALCQTMGKNWDPFLAYNLKCAQDPQGKAALQYLMKKFGIPKIPQEDLARINLPVDLIWGRHDRANKLQIAEKVCQRYGWLLHVIEESNDDPKLEQPEAFVQVIHQTCFKTIDGPMDHIRQNKSNQ